MAGWTLLDREDVALALRDFGGTGPAILLLHGLAGHAEEWRDTAAWLTTDHHVFALDARGHGRSERRPQDLGYRALVDDAVVAIEYIAEPVILIGQSLGGVTALLLAASRPNLARALVVVEASPSGMDEAGVISLADEIERKLAGWPVPFSTRDEAIAFFGGRSVTATAWTEGLEQREDGLWPASISM